MLAQDLVPILGKAHETHPLTIDELDITDKSAVFHTLDTAAPDLVVNCAAYSQVDQAENDTERAFRINAYGVQQLALACREYDVCLCHISTDYVFDGR
jgi:dTDP-4-dehydrorhamnose reductase